MQIDLSVNATQSAEMVAEGLPERTWRVFLAVYLTALTIVLLDLTDARAFLGAIDDRMRELQIRQFFSASGSWYDFTLPMIATPDPYFTPWSRLIDLPYIAIAYVLAPFFGLEKAILLSFSIWPPVMLSIFSLIVSMILRPHLKASKLLNYAVVIASVFLMIIAILEFVPGRIDHHNMQMIGLLMMLAGLQRWDRTGGILAGAGTLVCVVISLEGLPFIAVGFSGLVLCFLFDIRGAGRVLSAAALTILVFTLPAAFIFIGPAGIISTQCDAFSAPYILLAVGFSVTLAGGVALTAGRSIRLKLISLVFPAALVAAIFAILFPRCLSGPYWMIDPLSATNWLNRVLQEHSFIFYLQHGQFFIVMLLAILGCVAIMALPGTIAETRNRHAGVAIVFAVAVASLLITLLQMRNIRFAFAFIPLFLPLAIEVIRRPAPASFPHLRIVMATAVLFILASAATLRLIIPPQESRYDAIDYMAYSECPGQDFSVLSSQKPGRIAAPPGLGLPLAFAVPDGFAVAAVPFHRASPGMKRMFEAFTAGDSEVRRAALQPFDYVAVCRFHLAADPNQAPLYAELAKGGSWPGLERIPAPSKTDFQLFRIDHDVLK